MFYSKSTGGFYPADMRSDYEVAGTWPADAVEITDSEHEALLKGESAGKLISADALGNPVLMDIPAAAPMAPKTVTRRQAKQALTLQGLISGVQPAIDAIPDATQRALMQIEWDDSQVFERHRPALIMLAGALGLDATALDQLFITAAAL